MVCIYTMEVASLAGHASDISLIAFSPVGQQIVSEGSDKVGESVVCIWQEAGGSARSAGL